MIKQNNLKNDNKVRLADFINGNVKKIVGEWEDFARTLKPASNDMTPLALRNHIRQILSFIVNDIRSHQTSSEQIKKSHGAKERTSKTSVAEIHAALRLAGGFDIDQMVSEYRALRASVIKLWSAANTQIDNEDLIDLTRFNESIDQELAESVSYYTGKVSYSKDLFIGILSHELRNPLNAISMSTQLLLNVAPKDGASLQERQATLFSQIASSTSRVIKLINNLLEITRARFGSGLPIIRSSMNIGMVGKQLVDEMRAINPGRNILITVSGDLKGRWDIARIGQVFSNLIGNAIQYSSKNSPIIVSVKGMAKEVLVSVQNEGVPIPPEKLVIIFDSLTRAVTDKGEHPLTVNLGLGLYITKEIVLAHKGSIEVKSSKKGGTVFIVHLPRLSKR